MEVDGLIMMAEAGEEVAPESGAPEYGESEPPQMMMPFNCSCRNKKQL